MSTPLQSKPTLGVKKMNKIKFSVADKMADALHDLMHYNENDLIEESKTDSRSFE